MFHNFIRSCMKIFLSTAYMASITTQTVFGAFYRKCVRFSRFLKKILTFLLNEVNNVLIVLRATEKIFAKKFFKNQQSHRFKDFIIPTSLKNKFSLPPKV